MIGLWITVGVIVGIATLFAWIFIHEFSHNIAYKRTGKLIRSLMYLYPHMCLGKFYWGRLHVQLTEPLEEHERVAVAFAPRIPGIIGILLLWLVIIFAPCNIWWFIPVVFLCGACVDTITGSIGITPNSDLQRYAEDRVWVFRISQLLYAGLPLIFVVGWLLNR